MCLITTTLLCFTLLAAQCAQAVAALHAAGWLHSDLKPQNLMVEQRTGALRLLDFGFAVPADHGAHPAFASWHGHGLEGRNVQCLRSCKGQQL